MTLRHVVAILACVLAVPAVLFAWAFSTIEDPARYLAIVDHLAVPQTWQVAATDVQKDLLFGSRVSRYYLLDADPGDVVATAKQIVRASGFTVDLRLAPTDWCDTGPLSATPPPCPTKVIDDCLPNGRGGPVTCWVSASRGRDRLQIVIMDRGERTTYYVGSEGHLVGAPNRSVVVISAQP